MREPHFWRDLDPKSRAAAPLTRLLLTPAATLYGWAGRRRLARARPQSVGRLVICVGNLTLGGAGKTPVAAAFRDLLGKMGLRAASLSRGYGGSVIGPLKVDPLHNTAAEVGDEPLLLSMSGEAWIGRDRPDAARAMSAAGVEAIVMDDGHQNPSLHKHCAVVVIDAADPFGNRFLFPKGPLREAVEDGLARADAVVLMGNGDPPAELARFDRPILRAMLTMTPPPAPGAYVAFAGIGRPNRFFDALGASPGVTLVEGVPYPDHHTFTPGDLTYLKALASDRGALLITTEKDHVRLPHAFGLEVAKVPVRVVFSPVDAPLGVLHAALARAGYLDPRSSEWTKE